jgi:hypothetical protein
MSDKAVTFGADADEEVLNVVFDITFSGEILKAKFTHAAAGGPVSLIGGVAKVEPRGELISETPGSI